ncbi:SipW-dependent-type signal peptide-containing protein [Humibacter sp.]|uniref:SipW-dependent-type signal peptide-containing protein n=1 Tax=Humibacter sp. TaxID=1940291 RepID=UPI002BC212DD|nr:SipW-dependent-type signal peptide-containing protein [Humibacter sp.]HVX07435.1 SipW-dependent-type signal peptide-containing protein [Humibacter sp.]
MRTLLAGGLVLGAGAAVTVAAWTAQDDAVGGFVTSRFSTESTVNGGTSWSDNSTTPATLSLSAGALMPGDATAASFGIHATTGSVSGTESLQTPSGVAGALAPSLQYRVYRASSSACSATSAPAAGSDWLVGDAVGWAALSSTVPANSTPLAAGGTGAPGAPAWFCFQVRLSTDAPNSVQASGAQATWRFLGTSS